MLEAFGKYRLIIFCGIAAVALAPGIAKTAEAPGAATKVTDVYTHTDYGGGDVVIKLAWHHPNCSGGYWISPSQPGFDSTLSALLYSLATGTEVLILGLDHDLWPGSGEAYCKIARVQHLAP